MAVARASAATEQAESVVVARAVSEALMCLTWRFIPHIVWVSIAMAREDVLISWCGAPRVGVLVDAVARPQGSIGSRDRFDLVEHLIVEQEFQQARIAEMRRVQLVVEVVAFLRELFLEDGLKPREHVGQELRLMIERVPVLAIGLYLIRRELCHGGLLWLHLPLPSASHRPPRARGAVAVVASPHRPGRALVSIGARTDARPIVLQQRVTTG